MVQVEYDKKADAMYIWLKKAKYDISEELAENVILDLDKNGRIIGIEVLGASLFSFAYIKYQKQNPSVPKPDRI